MRSFNQPFLIIPVATLLVTLSLLFGSAHSAPLNPVDIQQADSNYKRHLLSSPPIISFERVFVVNDDDAVGRVQNSADGERVLSDADVDHHHHYHHIPYESFSKPVYPMNRPPFKLYPGSPAGLPAYFHKYAMLKKGILARLQKKLDAQLSKAAFNITHLIQLAENKQTTANDYEEDMKVDC
ncbi:hypothetical protein CPC08DRAFT_762987 [Agrocybe pediades]|nr:hypothetical protein CPC08DRAFT_762987 [Agrocybe pediades]